MKRLLFCISCTLLISTSLIAEGYSTPREINRTILHESQKIYDLETVEGTSDQVLWLYNDLGISFFCQNNFESALTLFKYILNVKAEDRQNLLVGAALWGRAVCHASIDAEDFKEDLKLLEQFFQSTSRCKHRKPATLSFGSDEHFSNLLVTTKVEFANPNEKISAAECRARVKGSADKVRLFVAPLIKDAAKRAIFITFINGLEDQGFYCCRDGSIWVSCVTPLLEKLEKWKIVGIPADPAWD